MLESEICSYETGFKLVIYYTLKGLVRDLRSLFKKNCNQNALSKILKTLPPENTYSDNSEFYWSMHDTR